MSSVYSSTSSPTEFAAYIPTIPRTVSDPCNPQVELDRIVRAETGAHLVQDFFQHSLCVIVQLLRFLTNRGILKDLGIATIGIFSAKLPPEDRMVSGSLTSPCASYVRADTYVAKNGFQSMNFTTYRHRTFVLHHLYQARKTLSAHCKRQDITSCIENLSTTVTPSLFGLSGGGLATKSIL